MLKHLLHSKSWLGSDYQRNAMSLETMQDTQRLRQIYFLRKALLQEFLFAAVTTKIHNVSQSSCIKAAIHFCRNGGDGSSLVSSSSAWQLLARVHVGQTFRFSSQWKQTQKFDAGSEKFGKEQAGRVTRVWVLFLDFFPLKCKFCTL